MQLKQQIVQPLVIPQGEFRIGPIANKPQYEKILRMIKIGIEEGATLVAGGVEKPEGYEKGYYVKPTVFANVTNDMTIAREEIFGPVLSILKYDSEEHAIEMANDTEYGLAGYVQGEPVHANQVARKIRAGQVIINGGARGTGAPFGGYKASGNGQRAWPAWLRGVPRDQSSNHALSSYLLNLKGVS